MSPAARIAGCCTVQSALRKIFASSSAAKVSRNLIKAQHRLSEQYVESTHHSVSDAITRFKRKSLPFRHSESVRHTLDLL
jgi:hypothetical protein